MTPGACIRALLALMLGVTGAVAQESLQTRGAWRLVAEGPDFALRTQALGSSDSIFSLLCRRQAGEFGFEIKSAALAGRPPGEDIRLGFKVDGDDQVWLTLTTGPNGTVPIKHQTAVWLIHEALRRDAARQVAFTAGEHTWQFALDGLAGLTESLGARCGFALSAPPPPGR